jgi:hypothetical protein
LVYHVLAQVQRLGGVCAFIDAEHAMDPSYYAKEIGVDIDELLVSQPDYGEQALEIADVLVRSGTALNGLPERNRAASFRSRSTICRTRWSEIPCSWPIALYVLLASLSRRIVRSRSSNAASRATRPGSFADRCVRLRVSAGVIRLPSVNANDSRFALSSSHSDCGVETRTSRGQRATMYSPSSRPTGLRLEEPLMP